MSGISSLQVGETIAGDTPLTRLLPPVKCVSCQSGCFYRSLKCRVFYPLHRNGWLRELG